jgi:signal transduction histidine kinase
MTFAQSFYAKLSALFLLLILGLGVILATLGVQAAGRYADEVEQKLNRTLAQDLAPQFQPLTRDSIHHAALRAQIRDLTGINRRIEIYLLGGEGRIKAAFAEPGEAPARAAVDTGPIQRFLEGNDLPILGDDPLHPNRQKPFSVAPITISGRSGCYLYIILGSEQYASMARMVGDSYIIRTALIGLGLILLVTAGVGLVLFRRLTQRLRSMLGVVAAFEQGNFSKRMEPGSNDEVGQLARCFNRMADTLGDTMDELRQADRMRRDLVANVSHDLRSPLASIQGYLETLLMKDDALDADERQRYLRTALKNAQRLSNLVRQLFELSKLDAQQVEPHREPFPMAELAQDIVMQYRPQAEAKDITLRADLPEQLASVYADIGLMERVLSNLIDNAVHYTPSGGHVDVSLTRHDGRVRAQVRDTGPGIPADDLPHIFERFYRVEKSRDQNRGGAGLGLAIAQKIVVLHGSTLTVESTMGEGTAFAFELPVDPPEDVAR